MNVSANNKKGQYGRSIIHMFLIVSSVEFLPVMHNRAEMVKINENTFTLFTYHFLLPVISNRTQAASFKAI